MILLLVMAGTIIVAFLAEGLFMWYHRAHRYRRFRAKFDREQRESSS